MNLTKSLRGGLGMRSRQDASESSSEPSPLYGGTSGCTTRGVGRVNLIGSNWSIREKDRNQNHTTIEHIKENLSTND